MKDSHIDPRRGRALAAHIARIAVFLDEEEKMLRQQRAIAAEERRRRNEQKRREATAQRAKRRSPMEQPNGNHRK